MPRIRGKGFPNFAKMGKNIQQLIDGTPNAAGVVAVNFFKERFKQKGWIDGGGLERWEKRAEENRRGTLMLDRGDLKRSINKKATKNRLIVSSDTSYSLIHNQGGVIKTNATVRQHSRETKYGKINVRSHNRTINTKIPKRQFMGHSDFLMKRINKQFSHQLDAIINNRI